MSQFFKNVQTGAAGPIDTLSAENGAATIPNGNNFNFSGTSTGGYGSNGAIVFSTVSPGEMNAQVQVDGTTVSINASNQLQAVGGFKWTTSGAITLTPSHQTGYLLQSGLNCDVTLPVSAVTTSGSGQYYFEIVEVGTGSFTIHLNLGDTLQFGDASTLIIGDTLVSTKQGDSLKIVAETSNVSGNQWIVVSPFGNLTIT